MVSDYRQERLETIRAINAKNRRRSKEMERRVMKELGGNRVPMSGAGMIKGDGQVFNPRIGYILVECKLSAGINKYGQQKIVVYYKWLEKIELERSIMNARMPILVIHHLDAKQDYVILHYNYYERYLQTYVHDRPPLVINTGTKGTWAAMRHKLEVDLADYTNYILLESRDNNYIVLTLEYFKELISYD